MLRSLLFLTLLSCTCIHAAYFDVNNCNTIPCVFVSPSGNDINDGSSVLPYRTLHAVVSKFPSGAPVPTMVVLADGTYPAALPEYPAFASGLLWRSNLSLTSVNGAGSTFLDCGGLPNVRGLVIGSGDSSTSISGITIQHCRTIMAAGMAIVGPNTKPIIRDIQFIDNQATNGGGILIFFASPTLMNVSISDCTGNNGGGMFIAHNASAMPAQQLQAISLALNYVSTPGAAPRGQTSYVNMSHMTFTNNVAVGPGGAYYLLGAYRVSCDNCVYDSNTGGGTGAIAAASGSIFRVTNSVFQHNQALQQNGGAISIQQGSNGFINNCSFIGNTANLNGGAIAVGGVSPIVPRASITNSTFDGNQGFQGSMVYVDSLARANVTGCTTRNNVAITKGGFLFLNSESALQFNVTSNTYENNTALGSYGADYGSYGSHLVFIEPTKSTQIGYSGTSPSIYPVNINTSLSRTIYNLDAINLKILLLDTFGQRLDLNESNQTGVAPGIYSDVTTLDNLTVPALLVQSTRVKIPTGVSDVQVVLVGELTKTYAVTFTSDKLSVQPIRLFVTIKPCNPYDYITYYDATTFPICHPSQNHHLSDSLFYAILLLSCILMACVVIVQGLTIWYWNTPVFKGSTPIFMSLMLLGAIIGYLATILSVIDVNRTNNFDTICKSQYWMMGIAFVLMFATLTLKTWRIRNIFCNETLTEIKSVTTWGLLRWLLLVIGFEMVIHIVWISIDPLHSTLRVFTGGQLATTCVSEHDNIFLIVNLVYKGLIAMVCVIFAYQTRDVASRFNESRQLMIASYNMFVCVIVIAALSLALPDPDARRTVYAVGALFVITSTWFVLFVPKIYLAMFKKDRNTSTGPAAPTGSGGKNNSHSTGKLSSHSDHHKSTDKYLTKSSVHNMSSGNLGACAATPHSITRTKGGSIGTAPSSPVVPPHRLALNLNQRSSMSNVIGPTTMSSPVGGSPHLQALANTMNIPKLNLTRSPQIQEDEVLSDHVVIDTEPINVTPFHHQSRRTSQPALYADTGYSMLEMNTINQNTSSPNTVSRSIPPAKNFI